MSDELDRKLTFNHRPQKTQVGSRLFVIIVSFLLLPFFLLGISVLGAIVYDIGRLALISERATVLAVEECDYRKKTGGRFRIAISSQNLILQPISSSTSIRVRTSACDVARSGETVHYIHSGIFTSIAPTHFGGFISILYTISISLFAAVFFTGGSIAFWIFARGGKPTSFFQKILFR